MDLFGRAPHSVYSAVKESLMWSLWSNLSQTHANQIGNWLGLAVLVWKTAYDLFYNPWKTKRARDVHKVSPAEAWKARQARSNCTTTIAFGLLIISYIFLIKGS